LISKLIIRKWERYFSYKDNWIQCRNSGDLKLQEYIHLRFEPGLKFKLPWFLEVDSIRESIAPISFPIIVEIFSTENGRPYLVGGVSATLNLSSNSKSIDDNTNRNLE
jgi:hypothetical protein